MLDNDELIKEASRIEEDAEVSAKAHYNAAAHWEKIHLCTGIAISILSVLPALPVENKFFFKQIISICIAGATGIFTFLRPSGKATLHKSAADDYLSLRDNSRIFKRIEIFSQKSSEERLKELVDERARLRKMSPGIPRPSYELAIRDINEGRTIYKIDKEFTTL